MSRTLSRRPRRVEEYDEDPVEDEYEEEERPSRGRRLWTPDNGRSNSRGAGRRNLQRSSNPRDLDNEDTGLVSAGWKGYKRLKEEAPSKWEKLYKPPENEEGLLKFLEDEPYANILQHWIEESKGQKGFFCLGKSNDCPLCEAGDVANAYVRFNVLDLQGDEPILVAYQSGITLTEQILKYASGKMGPLSNPNLYFAATMNVSGKGGKGQKRQSIRPLRARDLEEDFGWGPPLTNAELANWKKRCYTKDSLQQSTRAELEKVAELLS